jgi:hypothetical protein
MNPLGCSDAEWQARPARQCDALASTICRMGIASGTVVEGKVQVEGVALPEGAVVTVLTPDASGEVVLDAADESALLEAIAEAERSETISLDELWARLDRRSER